MTSTASTPAPGLSIGEVAHHTGIPIETLRFYDRSGLLGDLSRNSAGHRVFDERAMGLLDVVVRLRRTGMPVDDVRGFVDLVRDDRGIPDRIALLTAHRERVAATISQLQADLAVVDWKIAAYTAIDRGGEPPEPPPGWPAPGAPLPHPDELG